MKLKEFYSAVMALSKRHPELGVEISFDEDGRITLHTQVRLARRGDTEFLPTLPQGEHKLVVLPR